MFEMLEHLPKSLTSYLHSLHSIWSSHFPKHSIGPPEKNLCILRPQNIHAKYIFFIISNGELVLMWGGKSSDFRLEIYVLWLQVRGAIKFIFEFIYL